MDDIKNWLVKTTPNLVPYDSAQVEIGSFSFSMEIDLSLKDPDPLNCKFRSLLSENIYSNSEVKFSLPDADLQFQSVKRVSHAPFYVYNLFNENYSIYLIDFYVWEPVTAIYRIIYFQISDKNDQFQIEVPGTFLKLSNTKYKFSDIQLNVLSPNAVNLEQNVIKIPLTQTVSRESYILLSFSPAQNTAKELLLNTALSELNRLQQSAADNHILKYVIVQNVSIKQKIDELWCRQKYITPDSKPEQKVINKKNKSWQEVFWIYAIFKMMGWEFPFAKFEEKLKNFRQEPDRDLYEAYFFKEIQPELVIQILQSWWNRYSLPLYTLKLKEEIRTNPQKIYIIYSLAHRYRLPWYNILLSHCYGFSDQPQIALLILLQDLLTVKCTNDQNYMIFPGSFWPGNKKYLKRKLHLYGYTKFGQRIFTSFINDSDNIFKIDKEVCILHDKSARNIQVIPCIVPINWNNLRQELLTVEIGDLVYRIPLLWKKAEVFLAGLKIKIIYKKNRFQLTCHRKKGIEKFNLNREQITFGNSDKLIYYLNNVPGPSSEGFEVFDKCGKTFVTVQKSEMRELNILGWMQDQNGQLVENIDIKSDTRQWVARSLPSGMFDKSIQVSDSILILKIVARKIEKKLSLNKIENLAICRLLNFSPVIKKGQIVVASEDALKTQQADLQDWLFNSLGFHPVLLFESEITTRLNLPVLIHVKKNQNRYKIEESNSLSHRSYITVGYNQGKRELLADVLEEF